MKSDMPAKGGSTQPMADGGKSDSLSLPPPESELAHYLAWNQVPDIGPKQLIKIGNHFGSFFVAWKATADSDKLWDAFLKRSLKYRNNIHPEENYNKILNSNPNFLTLIDQKYPRPLLLSYPEPLLYYRGNTDLLQGHLLAIVGSRQLDQYGPLALRTLFQELKGLPIVIVSGLAFGVDALAHELALEYSLPTIAVVGSSVKDSEIYPRSNWYLSKKILAAGGLLLSPFPAGTAIEKHNFPKRNATIAGVSQGTLVISAAARSGALITAQLAMEAGRDVLALPGNINQPLSAGTNWLIKQGAQAVTCGQDIIEALGLQPSSSQPRQYKTTDPLMQGILQQLQAGPLRVEDLLERLTQHEQTAINIALSKMELLGWLDRRAGNYIQLK